MALRLRGWRVDKSRGVPNPAIAVHEIGHTLRWPHSFTGPDEYDNVTDVMSGEPDGNLCAYDYTAGIPRYACNPQHSLAFKHSLAACR